MRCGATQVSAAADVLGKIIPKPNDITQRFQITVQALIWRSQPAPSQQPKAPSTKPRPTKGRVLTPARASCPTTIIENIAAIPCGASTSPARQALYPKNSCRNSGVIRITPNNTKLIETVSVVATINTISLKMRRSRIGSLNNSSCTISHRNASAEQLVANTTQEALNQSAR